MKEIAKCSHGNVLELCHEPHAMGEYLDAETEPIAWAPGDPKWHTYRSGWIEGYRQAHWDMRGSMTPEVADSLLLERLEKLLRHLRECTHD